MGVGWNLASTVTNTNVVVLRNDSHGCSLQATSTINFQSSFDKMKCESHGENGRFLVYHDDTLLLRAFVLYNDDVVRIGQAGLLGLAIA
jgi:hypothetical protein